MAKAFASESDLAEKKISFTEIGRDLWAFTAEGDPNTGVIVGDDCVMVVDAQATPRLAGKVIEKIRSVTDKPIKYVVLSHYHAVRVLGASAYGASEIVMSDRARAMVAERGQEDWDSEFGRFPRLFQGHESIPGLTWPTLTFTDRLSLYLGKRRVDLAFLGRAHTAGDIVAYVPDENVMFKGVTWKIGRLYHGDREVYSFDLLPEGGHKMPAFINLQQYYVEQYLVDRAREFPGLIDLRFRNRVTSVEKLADGAVAAVETPDGPYRLTADYLLACDSAKSLVRAALGLEFAGKLFEERFLIADIELKTDFPPERRFWFEPTFHAGQSALLHKQPDDIYRIDLQLGPDADPEAKRRPENVRPRIERVLGRSDFEIDWVSVYAFHCRRLERFVHGRVIFVGDSAHVVSPFGARGGNGGIQDADNLGWKLAAVIGGQAPEALLESYNEERIRAADENIAHSSRATNFMTPKSAMEKMLRDEVLDLAADMPFARKLVNSGRLSTPCPLDGLPLQTPSPDAVLKPGLPCKDAPLKRNGGDAWLLNQLGGGFTLLSLGDAPRIDIGELGHVHVARPGEGELQDVTGHAFERYGENVTYLIRPDQHVAAAFRAPDPAAIRAARDRALARGGV